MKRVLLISGGFLASGAIAQPQPATLEPVTVEAATSEFKAVCVDHFLVQTEFDAARQASPWTYRARMKSPSDAMQPGSSWDSSKGILGYANADWMPLNLPSPQCHLNVAIAAPLDTSLVSRQIEAALGISGGKTRGKPPRTATQWDVTRPDGQKLRYFATLTSPVTSNLFDLSLTVMRLRGKK